MRAAAQAFSCREDDLLTAENNAYTLQRYATMLAIMQLVPGATYESVGAIFGRSHGSPIHAHRQREGLAPSVELIKKQLRKRGKRAR